MYVHLLIEPSPIAIAGISIPPRELLPCCRRTHSSAAHRQATRWVDPSLACTHAMHTHHPAGGPCAEHPGDAAGGPCGARGL